MTEKPQVDWWMLVQTYNGAVLWIPVLPPIYPKEPISVKTSWVSTILQFKPVLKDRARQRQHAPRGFLPLGFSFSVGYPLNFTNSGAASLSISRMTN